MPSNATGARMRSLAERFPGRLAHLISPGGWRTPFLPYALDNGAYSSYLSGEPFNVNAFADLIERARHHENAPLWIAVPDVVADAAATIEAWARWAPALRPFGWPLAFVVQDGMTMTDVPEGADIVFVGGSTEWKWATVAGWAHEFPRVHVGRVNRPQKLDYIDHIGVESCDGTGWFRGDQMQTNGLIGFLEGRTRLRLFADEELHEANP